MARGGRAEREAAVVPARSRPVHRCRRLRHRRIGELCGRAPADRVRRRLVGAERNASRDRRLRRRRTADRSAAADHGDRALVDQLVGQRRGRRRRGRVVAHDDRKPRPDGLLRVLRLAGAQTARGVDLELRDFDLVDRIPDRGRGSGRGRERPVRADRHGRGGDAVAALVPVRTAARRHARGRARRQRAERNRDHRATAPPHNPCALVRTRAHCHVGPRPFVLVLSTHWWDGRMLCAAGRGSRRGNP